MQNDDGTVTSEYKILKTGEAYEFTGMAFDKTQVDLPQVLM